MKLTVYQVYTRLFGNTNTTDKFDGVLEENGIGRFHDFTPTALRAIRDLGITHLWFTGVVEHATMAKDPPQVVKGRAGSPYAITDYYQVNRELAKVPGNRLNEFKALLDRTHAAGLAAVIDFVPNHVARTNVNFGDRDDTSVAFSPTNNFYYLPGQEFVVPIGSVPPVKADPNWKESPAKATGNDVFLATPSVDDWFETAKLNYGIDYQNGRQGHFFPVPDTWLRMAEILAYWTRMGVDGFRCDMAEMVPAEFWGWVIPIVKKTNPRVIFIAEIYNPDAYERYLTEGQFDLLYDKVGLYDSIRDVVEGRAEVGKIVANHQRVERLQKQMLNFLENHDEQRLASRFFAGDPEVGRPAMVVSTCLGQGSEMVYFGQEVGEPGLGAQGFSGDNGRTSMFDYTCVPEHQKWMNGGKFDGGGLSPAQKSLREFYRDLLKLASTSDLLAHGTTRFVDTGSPLALAWFREHAGEKRLFAANFARAAVEFVADGRPMRLGPLGAHLG
jgi:glycosidase